jgi:hypothetical protein
MAAPGQRKQLALDSNILFDLAAEKDFAHAFREVCLERGFSLRVPPTVIEELTYYALEEPCDLTPFARKALAQMLVWKLTPFPLQPVDHGIAKQFSVKLIDAQLLPEAEMNDGLILAETALAEIPVLVTRDAHLLSIDTAALGIQFGEADLTAVQVFHPNGLLKAMSSR